MAQFKEKLIAKESLEGRLLFAVPKKGRLNSATLDLLEGADIKFRRESRLDIALVKNLPIALIFLPAADIPTFVGEGRVDLGITGWDQVREHDAGIIAHNKSRRASVDLNDGELKPTGGCEMVMELGFGACKLQVQVPEKGAYATTQDLVGKTIGTSFVNLAEEHFAKLELGVDADGNSNTSPRKLRTKIIELSGSVEAACALGVADGIVDLVESGETMRAAGLKAIDTVVDSQSVLIKSRNPSNVELVELIAARIRGVITAQRFVLCQYNIERSRLGEAKQITPGKRAPTITTLDEEGWVAVSSMVEKKKIALVMDDLTRVGAQDILGVMTPIIFVSFLLSLVWVDLKYTLRRSRDRGHHHGGGWMPSWLHGIVYRRSPYTYMQKESTTPSPSPRSSPREEPGEFYYHSKQKKLMRMEMDDAFEVRGQVLVVVGAASLATLWGFWVLTSWVWRSVSLRGLVF
ncbi:ATP phosphoribosyltransferase [Colletotrichum gloeosporioides]|uniref:ATP phosphoribosyltransferase n=1 Tax=Colletotrichum gloeosporioides TaxID=474922 RepID=A0A8H4CJ18_COLGL|nr:ATP phosphoribosyltransferase [Colletotrichum gloeosporioides]KAF3804893.1 ATP phosphoribosyltransferase [Colletotrichum gloeosporioides]